MKFKVRAKQVGWFFLTYTMVSVSACIQAPADPAEVAAAPIETITNKPEEQAQTAPQKRALLIGVSTYDNLKPDRQLKGPANDVMLMHETLMARGFTAQNIIMLAEQDAKARPTHDAILRELDHLANTAKFGDQIFLYFSGHGSQQPNNDPKVDPELDGLDEIFLPADVKRWVDAPGTVENAITDDDIGARIATMRRSGAFVWLVADSCHSGTLYRGTNAGEVDRNIEPQELGVTPQAIQNAQAAVQPAAQDDSSKDSFNDQAGLSPQDGGFVGFYAAQSSELAPELMLPEDGTERQQLGLLTFNLAGILQRYQGTTYRQAAQQILHDYRAMGRAAPTPLFEGAMPDMSRFVFGDEAQTPQQWPVEVDDMAWQIKAGRLHRLSEGTILALVSDPAANGKEAILGYVRIRHAKAERSTLEPVAYEKKPAPFQLPKGVWARLIDARFPLSLTVALPVRPQQPSAREQTVWKELERLREQGIKKSQVVLTFVEPGEPAHVRLMVRDPKKPADAANPDDRLWLLPPSGELVRDGVGQTPAVTIPDQGAGKEADTRFRTTLADDLTRLARVRTLFDIAAELSENELAKALDIQLQVKRVDSGKTEALALTDLPALHKGDKLTIEVENKGLDALDLTILFVDSRSEVSAFFPDLPEQSNRLAKNEKIKREPKVNVETVGEEHLLFIAAKVLKHEEHADFSFLTQPGLTMRGGTMVNLPEEGITLFELIQKAGSSEDTLRGLASPAPVELAAIRSFSWKTTIEP